ncbi:MAG: hypothetical protein C0485_18750 [Pirellula sp.]|nr:hypothetical protein [Pirellula sp.]
MTAFASISMFVAISGAFIAIGDRLSIRLAGLLLALSVVRGLHVAGVSPPVISLIGCLLAARVVWVVAASPQRILWGELWLRAKARAGKTCPTKSAIGERESADSTSTRAAST